MATWTITITTGGGSSLVTAISPSNSGTGGFGDPYQVSIGDTVIWDNNTTQTVSVSNTPSGYFASDSFIVLASPGTQSVGVTSTGSGTTSLSSGLFPNGRTGFAFFESSASTDPPTISHVRHNEPNGNTATVTVLLEDSGSGGTGLKYAQSTTTSVPATGWQTSNTGFSQTRGTTRYYWASRDEDTANEFDGPETLVLPSANPHVSTLTAQNYGIEVANSSGKILYSTNRRSLVLIKQQQVTLSAGASTTITNIDNPEDKDQTFVLIGDQDSYVSAGTGNPVAVTGRSDSARTVTVTNQDTVSSRTVRVMVYRIC
jgi:hypothetical protein